MELGGVAGQEFYITRRAVPQSSERLSGQIFSVARRAIVNLRQIRSLFAKLRIRLQKFGGRFIHKLAHIFTTALCHELGGIIIRNITEVEPTLSPKIVTLSGSPLPPPTKPPPGIKIITGKLFFAPRVQMLSVKQSSLCGRREAASVDSTLCMGDRPNFLASNSLLPGSKGSGACQRNLPTGGLSVADRKIHCQGKRREGDRLYGSPARNFIGHGNPVLSENLRQSLNQNRRKVYTAADLAVETCAGL